MNSIPTAGGGWFVVYNHIPALLAAVEANTQASVKRKADDVLRSARGRIHRVSGHLQDSAFTKVVDKGHSASIEFPAEYATAVEFGTYKMSARPYLYPSILEHADDFFASIGKGVAL